MKAHGGYLRILIFRVAEQAGGNKIKLMLLHYSPDYNPIEYLWKKVKAEATHNRYFEEFAKLVQSVEDALQGMAANLSS